MPSLDIQYLMLHYESFEIDYTTTIR